MFGMNKRGGHRGHHHHGFDHHGIGRGGGGGFGGGMGGWGEGRGGMGGGRARRMFDGGELKLVLLKLIADAPRHGYDLIRQIEELTGGAYAPSPGVVYPTLTLLDDMGLIEAGKSEGAKKLFTVTEAGAANLAENAELVEALFARLAEVGKHSARSDGGPVRRAIGNLRAALQERVMKEDTDPETLHQIAALLDEVTQKIERL
jgi:DNA-binding PadR family transcriptional regulator